MKSGRKCLDSLVVAAALLLPVPRLADGDKTGILVVAHQLPEQGLQPGHGPIEFHLVDKSGVGGSGERFLHREDLLVETRLHRKMVAFSRGVNVEFTLGQVQQHAAGYRRACFLTGRSG